MIDIIEHESYVECIPHGKLTHRDYVDNIMPRLEELAKQHQPLNLLFLAVDFDGWQWQAVWDDLKTGMRHRHAIGKIALVTDQSLLRPVSKLFGLFIDGEIKAFNADQHGQAVQWLTHS